MSLDEVVMHLAMLRLATVFQSYQDDGRMIMEGCMQWNPVYS